MDRPLGCAAGNALEVEEAVQVLRGEGPADLREVTLVLAAEMLVLGGAARNATEARERAAAALGDGRALEKMREIVTAQGGDARALDDPQGVLPQVRARRSVTASRDGVVSGFDVRAIGLACNRLGAGRATFGGTIDPAVGFLLPRKPGDAVRAGEELAVVLGNDEARVREAEAALRGAIRIGDDVEPVLPLVAGRIADETGAAS
jgi:pyrimidine-nucleoside phosphorylase